MTKHSDRELEMYGIRPRSDLGKKIAIGISCGIVGAALGAGLCYLLLSEMVRIKTSVHVEMGDTFDRSVFFDGDLDQAKIMTDLTKISTSEPGTYQIPINYFGKKATSILEISDTTPPTGTAVPQTCMKEQPPEASETVKDLYDLSGTVYVQYSGSPNVMTAGETNVPVVLTDAYGNVSVVSVPFTVLEDTTPPVIEGVQNIAMVAGDPAKLMEGITVTDDYTDNPTLDVDVTGFDPNTPGTYEIFYVSADEAGNEARVPVTVTVAVRPEDYVYPDEVYARGREIYSQIITSNDLTDVQIAMRIFKWAFDNIKYVSSNTEKHWTGAAMQGFNDRRGECSIFYAVCKVLLDIAGIENMKVDGGHIWNLVKLNGQWYHCDACPTRTHRNNYWFMRLDSQLDSRFPFDGSELPERATEDVQGRLDFTNLTIN